MSSATCTLPSELVIGDLLRQAKRLFLHFFISALALSGLLRIEICFLQRVSSPLGKLSEDYGNSPPSAGTEIHTTQCRYRYYPILPTPVAHTCR